MKKLLIYLLMACAMANVWADDEETTIDELKKQAQGVLGGIKLPTWRGTEADKEGADVPDDEGVSSTAVGLMCGGLIKILGGSDKSMILGGLSCGAADEV